MCSSNVHPKGYDMQKQRNALRKEEKANRRFGYLACYFDFSISDYYFFFFGEYRFTIIKCAMFLGCKNTINLGTVCKI